MISLYYEITDDNIVEFYSMKLIFVLGYYIEMMVTASFNVHTARFKQGKICFLSVMIIYLDFRNLM